MSKYNAISTLAVDLSLAEELGFNPYYPMIEQRSPGSVMIGGRWFVDMASNDYCGLAADRALMDIYRKTIERFGVSLCGTPIASGGNSIMDAMEKQLAIFIGCESVMTFPSCYQANTSLFSPICTKDDCIIIDHFAHASLIEGAKAVGCRILPFIHNNVDHLEKLLARSTSFRQALVVTESVFSTEGAIAPFDRIFSLCKKYKALPVIDDSHGIGVLGATGRGILEYSGISDYDGIYTASLGKALANSGGIIAGVNEIIIALKYRCSGVMYSTGAAPAVAAGVCCVIDRLQQEFQTIRDRLNENVTLISAALQKIGCILAKSTAPIISVKVGTTHDTIRFVQQLYTKGIVATPFVEPSVPPGKGVVRLIPGAGIALERCREAAAAIETITL